jgi:hypothetical protein
MKIICVSVFNTVENYEYYNITIGNIYTVLPLFHTKTGVNLTNKGYRCDFEIGYWIEDDNKQKRFILKECFETLSDWRNKKIDLILN